MNQIHKFQLKSEPGANFIDMPQNAVILHVHEQHNKLCIWAMVDLDANIETRIITVLGTGWDFNPTIDEYIGTAHVGIYVRHVFDSGVDS